MIFKITTTVDYYNIGDAKVQKLKDIGFTFVPGKSRLSRSDDLLFRVPEYIDIEINSLDELISLSNKFGEIIIHSNALFENNTLEIYNGYRE